MKGIFIFRRLHRRKNPRQVGIDNRTGEKFGPKTVFTEQEEIELARFIVDMKALGQPRNKKKFQKDIQFMVKYFQIETPFKDGIPG